MSSKDKQWAREYILDPLTAPEPSQETGPGTSFYNPQRQSLLSSSPRDKQPSHLDTRRKQQPVGSPSFSSRSSGILTPPSSASPTRNGFHPSNPFARSHPTSPLASPVEENPRGLSPPNSAAKSIGRSPSHRRYPPVTTIGRSSSTRVPGPADRRHHRSFSADPLQRDRLAPLPPRFPGDLTHRPLEMIKRETRTANRSGGHRRGISDVDTIDALDTIGGTYHHGGPFDATLASRNINAKYPPVDAVHETNMEAIRATPREFIQDSLDRHVPLQGIATIPPGETDMSGKVMDFQEGADLMREPDAAGGAYKRWEGVAGITYHPDDLKGKGEPSYTYEKDKAKGKGLQRGEYEMQSGVNGDGILGPAARPRSVSNADKATSSAYAVPANGEESGLRRSNTTGKKISEGLKRRFGSLRKKRGSTSVEETY